MQCMHKSECYWLLSMDNQQETNQLLSTVCAYQVLHIPSILINYAMFQWNDFPACFTSIYCLETNTTKAAQAQ